MEQLLFEIAKQVPSLLVLVLLVNRFLTALKERDDGFRALATTATDTQREANQLLGKVSVTLDQMGQESSKTRSVLHQVEQALNNNTAALRAAPNRS